MSTALDSRILILVWIIILREVFRVGAHLMQAELVHAYWDSARLTTHASIATASGTNE